MMPIGDREKRAFLSNPQTNNELFYLLTTKHHILYWKTRTKRLQENPEFAEIRHGGVILTLQ